MHHKIDGGSRGPKVKMCLAAPAPVQMKSDFPPTHTPFFSSRATPIVAQEQSGSMHLGSSPCVCTTFFNTTPDDTL